MTKLFNKYEYTGLEVKDISLKTYINLRPLVIPHTHARHANKQFAKAKVNLVERLANKLMRGGTGGKLGGKVIRTKGALQGKKLKVLNIIEQAFDSAAEKTKKNPIQLLILAVENSAPREDVTRVRLGGVSYQVAVDIGAMRRLDLALGNIALAALTSAFKKRDTVAVALANEIILASSGDQTSYSIKRRNETERMARSAR